MNILVAEDHPTNQMIVRHHLENHHHRVTIAPNGQEVLDRCDVERFDLILMDVQMPVLDGIEATRRIREGGSPNRDVPIVAITASGEQTIRDGCIAAGMNDVVAKPLLFARLVDLLHRWGDGAQFGTDVDSHHASTGSQDGASPTTTTPPLDFTVLMERLNGDRDFAKVLFDGFCAQTERLLEEMKQSLNVGDMAALHRTAHTIKGAALNIAADDLQTAAKHLEETVRDHSGEASPLLARIESEYLRLRTYLVEENLIADRTPTTC